MLAQKIEYENKIGFSGSDAPCQSNDSVTDRIMQAALDAAKRRRKSGIQNEAMNDRLRNFKYTPHNQS